MQSHLVLPTAMLKCEMGGQYFFRNKHNFWGKHHSKIKPKIEKLTEYAKALAYTIDQTGFLYGSSGLKFIHSGDNAGEQRHSNKPRAKATGICAQNGLTPWQFGLVFKQPFKKNEDRNEIELKSLYHGELAVDEGSLIYFQKTGSCDSKILAQYCIYHWLKMPKGPKIGFQDVAKCNSGWIPTCAQIRYNVRIVECQSYLTSVLAGPDDRFFNFAKNGYLKTENGETKKVIGIKQRVQDIYNSDAPFPKGPERSENGAILPLNKQVFWHILKDVLTKIDPKVMFQSMHSCGFFVITNFYGHEHVKEFVQRAFVTDRKSLAKKVAPKTITLVNLNISDIIEIMIEMRSDPKIINAARPVYRCPAPACQKSFKTLKSQVAHSISCRILQAPCINPLHAIARREVEKIADDEERNKAKARCHRITVGKTIASNFNCPCCDFYRWRWKKCSAAILRHYTDTNWKHYCTTRNDNDIIQLFRTHPLFSSARLAL